MRHQWYESPVEAQQRDVRRQSRRRQHVGTPAPAPMATEPDRIGPSQEDVREGQQFMAFFGAYQAQQRETGGG